MLHGFLIGVGLSFGIGVGIPLLCIIYYVFAKLFFGIK
jgi:hypothetical protein